MEFQYPPLFPFALRVGSYRLYPPRSNLLTTLFLISVMEYSRRFRLGNDRETKASAPIARNGLF